MPFDAPVPGLVAEVGDGEHRLAEGAVLVALRHVGAVVAEADDVGSPVAVDVAEEPGCCSTRQSPAW